LVRIIDDGSNNIQSGDFAQILEKLDPKDVALVGAFCSVIQSISADKNTFIKSVTQNIPDESKDGFSSSPLVSDGVIKIINSHATACVGELEKVNNIKASFDIPNLFDFEETGETLLENSSENVLEKSRAELKEIEIADQKRLKEEQRIEEERLAKAAQIAEQQRIARVKQELKAAKEQKEKRLAEKEKDKALKMGEWNTMRIRVVGDQIESWLNGTPMISLKDEKIGEGKGSIALQIHDGGGIKVRWRNLVVTPL